MTHVSRISTLNLNTAHPQLRGLGDTRSWEVFLGTRHWAIPSTRVACPLSAQPCLDPQFSDLCPQQSLMSAGLHLAAFSRTVIPLPHCSLVDSSSSSSPNHANPLPTLQNHIGLLNMDFLQPVANTGAAETFPGVSPPNLLVLLGLGENERGNQLGN